MSENEVNIIHFDPESGMNLQFWITHLDKSCLSNKKDEN